MLVICLTQEQRPVEKTVVHQTVIRPTVITVHKTERVEPKVRTSQNIELRSQEQVRNQEAPQEQSRNLPVRAGNQPIRAGDNPRVRSQEQEQPISQ